MLIPKNFSRDTGIIIAGHLDTVPGSDVMTCQLESDKLYGLGAVDMKGGIAIMVDLARRRSLGSLAQYVFYVCEEISREHSGLLEIQRDDPNLLLARGAILMEPTGGAIEVGCQGTAKFNVHICGRRAHSARPWMGSNAIHNSSSFLSCLASHKPQRIQVEGCEYAESITAVGITGGIAGNVVPDEVDILINYRFAPGRDDLQVLETTKNLLASWTDLTCGDSVTLLEWAPSAPPNLSNPVIAKLGAAKTMLTRAKLGWTDVAFFWEQNIPACNFGPGDPNLAHTKDEVVSSDELYEVWNTIVWAFGENA